MPILARESDVFPDNLFEEGCAEADEARWLAVYTRSRHEKKLMRQLRAQQVPHYGPLVAQRQRSSGGRVRTSWCPLFSNYVFVLGGDGDNRTRAMATNCVSRIIPVQDSEQLTRDLRAVHDLLSRGVPVAQEPPQAGTRVRVRSGILRGCEGTVVRRHGRQRLIVAVDFLQQGAAVELENCDVERVL